MFSFFNRFLRTIGGPPPVLSPAQKEANLQRLESEAQERTRLREVDEQLEFHARHEAARSQQLPGELWLHTPQGPQRAIARSPKREQGAANDNKLVLGHAGSGRSLMLARLAKAAHEAGNHVVVINNFGTNPNNPGPLWMLTHSLGGNFNSLSEPEELRFNPFWLPESNGADWRKPTQQELNALATVLVNVLRLTRYDQPSDQVKLEEWMGNALSSYFQAEPSAAGGPPSFAGFADWLAGQSTGAVNKSLNDTFLVWFARVSPPFLDGGALQSLLSATPDELRQLVGSPARILHVEVALCRRFATEADTPGFIQHPWPHEAPEAQTRALLLLLHTLDIHLGQQEQRLTVVADELHYDSLGRRTAVYLDRYLRRGEQFNREVVTGWHESPKHVFSHPGAEVLLGYCGTQLLLADRRHRSTQNVQQYFEPLALSEEESNAFIHLKDRGVIVRHPGTDYAQFDAQLATADLKGFVPQKFLNRLAEA